MSAVCPRCGAAAAGRFCSACGSSVSTLTCPACGHAPPPGARFCNKCGAALAGAASPPPAVGPAEAHGDSSLAWWIAGGTLVLLIVLIAWPVIHPDESPQPPFASGAANAPGAGAPGMGVPPDLSRMTPREAADRLFQRVMTAVEMEDEATVQMFLPMALEAHEIARPLDEDGLYHMATLKRAAADFSGSLATAREGLAAKPDHLLLLAAAADAAEGMGDSAQARAYWQHFVRVYDLQRALGLEGYTTHEGILEQSLAHAREVVGG